MSLPFALRPGPVHETGLVVLITGIVADRIMDLSKVLTGLATNPCKLLVNSSDEAEVLVSLPRAFVEPGSVCEETLPETNWIHPAVKQIKTIRIPRIPGQTIPARKWEYDIG